MQIFQITVLQTSGGLDIDNGPCGSVVTWDVGIEELSHPVSYGPLGTSIRPQMVCTLDFEQANVLKYSDLHPG